MATYYSESNIGSTDLMFSKKVLYRKIMRDYASTYTNLTDFYQAEKFLYGRVSRDYVPFSMQRHDASTAESISGLKSFTKATLSGKKTNLRALNFVVDAFRDLSLQFEKCAMTGKINPNDNYLSNLTVYRAYEDPYVLYDKYIQAYFTGIADAFKRTGQHPTDFDEFVSHLVPFLVRTAGTLPLTFPAFIKSRQCPINVSGLAVEIADLDASNDLDKKTLFIDSENWEFYLNACRSYGFMVDQNAPWRIVADIGSSEMLKYAAKYGITQTDTVFMQNYIFASDYYYKSLFRRNLLKLYTMCVPASPIATPQECHGNIITNYITARQYTYFDFKVEFGPEYFLRLYFDMRFLESENIYSEAQRIALVTDCMDEWRRTRNSTGIILKFETIINKTFDYRGSLNYNNTKHIPALRDDIEDSESESGTTAPIGPTVARGASGGGY